MNYLRVALVFILVVLTSACNVTPDLVSDLVESNSVDKEYPSKARFKRMAQERQDRIDARFDDSGVAGFFNAFLSSDNDEYPSRKRFAKQGLLKDTMLMQELRERKVGANHHIPELMQVAVTTDNDPRWVPIVGHKRRHASFSEPEVDNPRFVALVGPK